MRKVLNSWSVATGLISVRRLTYLPTTKGALLNPRILQASYKADAKRGQCLIEADAAGRHSDSNVYTPVKVKGRHFGIVPVVARVRLALHHVVSAVPEEGENDQTRSEV